MIKSIEVSGFKNFPGESIFAIKDIPDGFILIGGLNARGKTSLYQSLAFAFGASKGVFFRQRIRKLVNYNPSVTHCFVKVVLQNRYSENNKLFPGIDSEEVIIERVMGKIDSSHDYIKINDTNVNQAQLQDLLRQVHIDANNPFQFIGQNQLGSIIIKKSTERLKLLDIFIPASKTGQEFVDGLRKIKLANKYLQQLHVKETVLQKEELLARDIREKYEKKMVLEEKVQKTGYLLKYLVKKELLEKKNEIERTLKNHEDSIQIKQEELNDLVEELEKKQEQIDNEEIIIKNLDETNTRLKRKKGEIDDKIREIKAKFARIEVLKKETEGKTIVDSKKAKLDLETAYESLSKSKSQLKSTRDEIGKLSYELDLLKRKKQPPYLVREVINKAKNCGITAFYTFDGVEWNIQDEVEKKRVEIIFSPIKHSICVSDIESGVKLIENSIVDVPILVAHSKHGDCTQFKINGTLCEERSALLDAILNEWSNFKKTFTSEYKRQIMNSGYVLNLVKLDKWEHRPFIGHEGFKSRMSELKDDLKQLDSNIPNLKSAIEKNEMIRDRAYGKYDISVKNEELQILMGQEKNAEEELLKLETEKKGIEIGIGKIDIDLINSKANFSKFEDDFRSLGDEELDIRIEIEELEDETPSIKKLLRTDVKKLQRYVEDNISEIELGEEIFENRESVGSIGGLKDDLTRWKNELIEIGDVPEDAVVKHDSAKKRLERIKHKLDQQSKSIDINPERVKEDITLYERTLRKFINDINIHFNSIMDEFNGEGKLELINLGLDEESLEYSPGLNIKVKFRGRESVIVDEYSSLSGGEKTRIIMSLLLALIRSQEQRHEMPFLVLDEFDVQLDEPGHIQVMNLLQREIGAKQVLVFSPNRLEDKALYADMLVAFTNEEEMRPEVKIMALKGRSASNEMS